MGREFAMYRLSLPDNRIGCARYDLPSAQYRTQPAQVYNKHRATLAIWDHIRSGTSHRNVLTDLLGGSASQNRQALHSYRSGPAVEPGHPQIRQKAHYL